MNMKSMKWKCLAVIFAVLIVLCAVPGRALALELRIQNDFSNKLSTAVVFYDDASAEWKTKGWYIVDAKSSKTFRFSTSKADIYLYSQLQNSNITWGSGDVTRTIISETFEYRDGNRCPDGSNRRNVGFTKYTAAKNVVNYKPVDTSGPLANAGEVTDGGWRQNRRRDNFEIQSANIVNLFNNDRQNAGLKPLLTNDRLNEAASVRAREMTQKKDISVRPDGRRYNTVLADYGLSYENTWSFYNTFDSDSSLEMYAKFIADRDIKRRILSSDYTDIGVGIIKSGDKYICVSLLCSSAPARDKTLNESWRELKDAFRELRDAF